MSDQAWEKALERVAREWIEHSCGDDTCDLDGAECLAKVLQRELGPLLEAGQAMRDIWIGSDSVDEPVYANGAWDAAKAALLAEARRKK